LVLEKIIDIIESVAPLSHQEEWDNSGLQIGHKDADIASVLCCTDVTEAVIDEAVNRNCQLVISHHPLLFHAIKTIQGCSFQERVVESAIRNGIAIYSSHTAMDVWIHGVSGRMAEKLGISDYSILSPTISAEVGLGVIGELEKPVPIEQFLAQVKEIFHVPAIRYTRSVTASIKRVALAGGACAELVDTAVDAGADAFISADFRHHEFLQADGRIMVLDIGHFESEQYTKEIFRDLLRELPVDIYLSEADRSPVHAF